MRRGHIGATGSSHRRRQFLKTVAAATAVTVGSSSRALAGGETPSAFYTPGDEFAASAEYKEEYQYNIDLNEWYKIGYTINGLGGCPVDNGNWGTTFRNHGYGLLRRYDADYSNPDSDPNSKKVDQLEGHEISYKDGNDGNNSVIGYKYDDGYLGGWPTPEYTELEIAQDLLEGLGEIIISELEKVAGLVLSALELFENISNNIDEANSDTYGDAQTFEWNYGGSYVSDKQSDVTHFSEITYEQEYDTVSTFYTQNRIYEGTVDPYINWKVDVDSPDTEQTTCACSSSAFGPNTTSKTRDQMFSSETVRKYGMRKIPVKEARRRGIKNAVAVDGDKTWWATKLHGRLTPVATEQGTN